MSRIARFLSAQRPALRETFSILVLIVTISLVCAFALAGLATMIR
jgi:hypothetical protein